LAARWIRVRPRSTAGDAQFRRAAAERRQSRLQRPLRRRGRGQLYSFGTYSHRVSDLPFTFRAPTNVNALPQVYPDGFRPNLVIKEDDFELAIGARGDLQGWSWDVSSTYGKNLAKEHVSQSINASLGPASPTHFYVGKLVSSEWVNSLDVTRGLHGRRRRPATVVRRPAPPRDLSGRRRRTRSAIAAGTYVIPVGQPSAGTRPATGAQAAPGFQPTDASKSSRNNYAAYGEVGYSLQKLFLGAAVRYEDYDDASGDTVVGKVNGRYELTSWLAVRGAASTGFRAPGLAQENYAASSSQFRQVNGVLDLLQIKTLPVGSREAIALGAEPLKPEKSKNYSLGVTLEPLPRLSVSLDAYQIDVDGRIAITSTLTGDGGQQHPGRQRPARLAERPVLHQRHRHPHAGRRPGHGLSPGAGRLRHAAPDARLQSQQDRDHRHHRQPAGTGGAGIELRAVRPPEPGLPDQGLSQGQGQPGRQLVVGQAEREPAPDPLRQLQDPAEHPANDRKYGAKWITDLEVGYKVLPTVNVAIGANNLLNIYPSRSGASAAFNTSYNINTGTGQYPGTSPFGFTGGSYYARVQWDF
jgi:iron complex outermembrane receptor protein